MQELWFVATYVATYLRRNEPIAAKVVFGDERKHLIVRRLLDRWIGLASNWTARAGFFGHGLRHRPDASTFDAFSATYVGADPDANWTARFATTDLFCRAAAA